MTSYEIFGYNYLIIPRFDFMLKTESGLSFFLRDSYMKYFALFCCFCGFYTIFKTLNKFRPFSKKLLAHFNKPKINPTHYIVILGFGDTIASINITKYFSNLGYHIIALNNKKIINFRRQHDMNKIQEIDNLKVDLKEIIYEDISTTNFEFLSDKKIDFIFDCSIFRVFTDNRENIGKDEVFFRQDIQNSLDQYYSLFNLLLPYFNQTKIFLMEYIEKEDDVNHKLLFDLKYSLLNNYTEIYKEKIFSLKSVKLFSIIKNNILKEQDIKQLYLYSNIKEVEFKF